MIYLVLGMHKSGTTLISQILHKSGINMGELNEEISYDRGNKYERFEFLIYNSAIMNIRILDGGVKQYRKITNLDHFTLPLLFKSVLRDTIERVDQKYENWGCKDPRMCLTYEVWESLLPEHKIISVIRNPFEVADRFCKYVNKFRILKRLRTRFRVIESWYLHNISLLEIMEKNRSNSIVVDYNKLMSSGGNGEFEKIENLCNRKLVDAREKSLYRNRKNGKRNISDKIIEMYFKYALKKDIFDLYHKLINSPSR
jgi:hypothetical protein